ncbi:MAG TPA: nucleotide pyrophosphohydrolase [Candidatus Paceibacterota bacterium]|jgi:NTP pyrophosphatase (non-canonical NTP hydrolase)|nr:nucleotide pyrophosphohydrolase [Candidatus Paceibacterota bacterium]
MKKYQKAIDDWVQGYEVPYWPPLSIFARVAEEVGEVGRILNHMYGSKPKKLSEEKQELGEEIADVMFALICLANSHDIDLDVEIEKVIQKSKTRDKDRFNKKQLF